MVVSVDEVEVYLLDVINAIKDNRFKISQREKNRKLVLDYILDREKIKEIILSLTVKDFSSSVNNIKEEYSSEILYIFGKDVMLLPRFGSREKKVSIYIKFNKIDDGYIIVVSFHEQQYPLKYPFKWEGEKYEKWKKRLLCWV